MATLHVLLVDDNPDDRLFARRAIEREFPDARFDEPLDAAAFAVALTATPDIVVTDYRLGWSNGLEILKAVREHQPGRPVIMLTSTGNEEICAEGLRLGLSDYLIKRRDHYLRLPRAIAASLALARQMQTEERHKRELEASERRLTELLERERVAHEASERLRAEAQRANRVKDEFLSVLSHELRTPLSAVLNWVVLLQRRPDDAEAVQRGLAVIERNAKAQVALIEDLLDLGRVVSGKLRLEIDAIEAATPVRAAVEAAQPAAEAAGVRLELAVDEGIGRIRGDAERVQQIVSNLLSNALKFTPSGGRVSVAVKRGRHFIEIAVADTGVGIPADFLPHVFDGFRQGDTPIRSSRRGLGIGLSIVKSLVKLHGGVVHARSAGKDRGAEFIVCLPVANGEAHADRPDGAPTPEATAAQGVRILLVEDDPDTREVLVEILRAAGAEPIAAGDAETGLRLLVAQRPTVLVSDIGLPGRDGYQLIQSVRALPDPALAATPSAALTAYGRLQDRQRALLAGFDLHLLKPVDADRLLGAVATLARRATSGLASPSAA